MRQFHRVHNGWINDKIDNQSLELCDRHLSLQQRHHRPRRDLLSSSQYSFSVASFPRSPPLLEVVFHTRKLAVAGDERVGLDEGVVSDKELRWIFRA